MEIRTIQKLTTKEANAIDIITRVYKLPFSVSMEDDGYDGNDCIYDSEEDENLSLFEGLSFIIEAINCDDRELFNTIDTEITKTFTKLCKELNLS